MMTGTVRWNLFGGLAAFILTFLLSVSRNILITTLLRSLYSFLLLFMIVFIFRFVLQLILNSSRPRGPLLSDEPDTRTGMNLDLSTPDEVESLNEVVRANLEERGGERLEEAVFVPLKPPQLASKTGASPQDMANGLRRMSQE